ncbi:alpha/beta-hydrolase [Penicillium argentinense]|uniref:Alpha/beta-hydrolase n=1 Tax=Penicillium argentinense TaxID=1131581 RepID=A0A9W9G396_9EURO|nr:alpha/beta-hydrolase [Penicillium argentinense]KAJ5111186.1 alpha/beta-hydrolase [Penicillium argentinense]
MSPSLSDTSILSFPFLATRYLHPRYRQEPSWSYRQAVTNTFLKIGLWKFSTSQFRPTLSLKPGLERDRFVLVDPARPELYTGVAVDKEVKPETIGGTWYPKRFSSDTIIPEDQHVVLHFHGGSYILGDGRTASSNFLAKTFLNNTSALYIFCPQYRLAGSPTGRFPAQLQDAIASYSYLVHMLRIPASQVVLSGDSSGAHLVLGLLRYIFQLENPLLLPPPICSWAFSPWCDVPAALDKESWHRDPNYKTDYIPSEFPAWGAKNYLKNLEITRPIDEQVAPIRHPFPLPSPVLIVTGGKEILFQQHLQLAQSFLKLPENRDSVELYSEERVPHDILVIGWMMNFRHEARKSARRAGDFLLHTQKK